MKVGFREAEILLSVPMSGDIRTLQSELTYFTQVVQEQLLLVPKGIKTDLGSIPLFLQNIFPKDGKAMFAYILHDYLYQVGIFERLESDEILDEAMASLGVVWWRRKAVKLCLRVCGWDAWNKHRNKKKGGKL
ncbi:MAG TPA: DUF1353 domain-containing protein [Sulfurimonas sp.]|nr:DUF1353 domain-containing protein [Sulfurimonas sp.]